MRNAELVKNMKINEDSGFDIPPALIKQAKDIEYKDLGLWETDDKGCDTPVKTAAERMKVRHEWPDQWANETFAKPVPKTEEFGYDLLEKIRKDNDEQYAETLERHGVVDDFRFIESPKPKTGLGIIHDAVNTPKHYTWHPTGVDQIEISEHMTFNLGNAIKYIWRAGRKGDIIEDLSKARFYIEREINRLQLDQADEWVGESK